HIPRLRCRGDEHGARGGTRLTQWSKIRGSRLAAHGGLRAIGRVEIGLHDSHAIPWHVEFLGDNHRQRGLRALAHLRIRRKERHLAVRRDTDEGIRRELGRTPGGYLRDGFRGTETNPEHETATGQGSQFEKRTPIERRSRVGRLHGANAVKGNAKAWGTYP